MRLCQNFTSDFRQTETIGQGDGIGSQMMNTQANIPIVTKSGRMAVEDL